MTCDDLARTGTELPWVAVLLTAMALIALGVALLNGDRRRRAGLAVLVVLCLAGASAAGPAPLAVAACISSPSDNSLTIVQTSTNDGLSPTQPPSLITGRVTNNGDDETIVTAVVVSIGSVAPAPSAAAGTCGASDYVLLDARMPVGVQLAAGGGSTIFSGARIGFLDSADNQDACQGAVVTLLYTTE